MLELFLENSNEPESGGTYDRTEKNDEKKNLEKHDWVLTARID